MLRLTLCTEEYLMIGEDIKIIFLGGTKNNLRIMVDAPKDMRILRSNVITRDHPELADHKHYYEEPLPPARYLKQKQKS